VINTYYLGLFVSILGILFGLYIRKKLKTKHILFWIALWATIGVFSVFPSALDTIKDIFSFGYRAYFVFTISILALFLLNFYLSIQIDRLQKDIVKISQEFALFRYKIKEELDKKVTEKKEEE